MFGELDGADPVTTDWAGPRPRLAISACLLGHEVRFDGGHKRDRSLLGSLGPYVDWVPLCPEVEAGMGTPRPSIRQVRVEGELRVIAPRTERDWTAELRQATETRMTALASIPLDGIVVKKDSPSCGMERVKVYSPRGGAPSRDGVGVFTAAFRETYPHLPAEEEGRLRDPLLREHFVDRVFSRARFRQELTDDPTPAGLLRFHTRHKLIVLAHSPEHYRLLGPIAARAESDPWEDVLANYGAVLSTALNVKATPGRHVNVLQHLAGHVKNELDGADKTELLESMERYRTGQLPLVVPMTLLAHHLRRNPRAEWAQAQVYLEPYPRSLMLRNVI